MHTVLVIEDERDLADLIACNLQMEGYRCFIAGDGVEGVEMVQRHKPDLVLLDLMLPRMLGAEVCKLLKKDRATKDIPVIMVTAKGDEIDKVVGFELGAEDYVVKPFSLRELMLRVKVALRRTFAERANRIRVGDVTIDPGRHLVTVNGVEVGFTVTEFNLLHTLARGAGMLQRRDTLLKQVWGEGYTTDSRTVDTHVTRVRNKLGAAGEMVKTVRGLGYVLEG